MVMVRRDLDALKGFTAKSWQHAYVRDEALPEG